MLLIIFSISSFEVAEHRAISAIVFMTYIAAPHWGAIDRFWPHSTFLVLLILHVSSR